MRLKFFLFFFVFSFGAKGQQWMNWNSASLSYSPIKRINISVGGQYRWNVSESIYAKTMFSARIKGKITKYLSLQLRYRRSWMPNEYFYLDHVAQTYGHRGAVGLEWDIVKTIFKKKEGKKWHLRYSTLWQVEQFKFKRAQEFWRNKIELAYKIPAASFSPFLNVESFYRLNQSYTYVNDKIAYTGALNEMRYGIGIQYSINEIHELKLEYLYRYFQPALLNVNVIRLEYTFDLSKTIKKHQSASSDRNPVTDK